MFKIPINLTTGALHTMIEELSALENQSLIFDWKNCNNITNEAHCAILHLKEITKAKKITLIHEY